MRIKHIIVSGLLVAVILSGCAKTMDNVQVTMDNDQEPEIAAVYDGAVSGEKISFSAGDEIPPPIVTPRPMQSEKPTEAAAAVQVPDQPAAKETAVPTPKEPPKPASSFRPAATPTPTAAIQPTASPKPTTTPQPTIPPTPIVTPVPTPIPTQMITPTPVVTPVPTVPPAPTAPPIHDPPPARTICNTCGADITGNVPAHGDGHLLNNENFSYRVE